MKLIPLSQGKFTKVDDEDYDELMNYHWCYLNGRVRRYWSSKGSKRQGIYLHRQILKAGPNDIVDHIDRDPLNNCKSNLRFCTIAENNRNSSLNKNSTSGYKGVHKFEGRWVAQIRFNNKCLHLGWYENKIDAALAYDKAAKELHGEFACLNFPDQSALNGGK